MLFNFDKFVIENYGGKYPTIKWLKSALKNNIESRVDKPILAAYIVGSEAKGTAREDSDLDIAIIISPIRGKTALQFTDNYHAKFSNERWKPHWKGRIVDFQFFYPEDPELKTYTKLELK